MRNIAIEVWFVFGFLAKIAAAFDGHGRGRRPFSPFGRDFPATHLGALLLENGLAREPNAIAFHGKDLYQHLVAFFQFVANVLNAVLGNFADMKQAVGAGDNFDESAKIGEAGDGPEVGFTYFGGSS